MNICRQCFREKSTDIGFVKVRTFILHLCRLENQPTATEIRDIVMSEFLEAQAQYWKFTTKLTHNSPLQYR